MTSKRTNEKPICGSWAWEVPSTAESLCESNLEFAEVVFKAFKCFEGFFLPEFIVISWRRVNKNHKRGEVDGQHEYEFRNGWSSSSYAKASGLTPQDVRNEILDVLDVGILGPPAEFVPPVLTVWLYGLVKLFCTDQNGNISESWEERDAEPGQHPGTLDFAFTNPFPRDYLVWIHTHSSIFNAEGEPEVSARNKNRLEKHMERLKRELGAKLATEPMAKLLNHDSIIPA